MNPRLPVLAGFAAMALLFYSMSHANPYTTTMSMSLLMIGIRVALNLIHTPLTRMALAALEPHQVREGSGLEGVVRGIGGAFGVALTGVILEKRQSWHFGSLVETHGLASIDSVRLLDGVRELLGGHGAVGHVVDVQARSLLNRQFEQAAQVGAFQDVLLLLALLQVVALLPTLLIRAVGRGTASPSKLSKHH